MDGARTVSLPLDIAHSATDGPLASVSDETLRLLLATPHRPKNGNGLVINEVVR